MPTPSLPRHRSLPWSLLQAAALAVATVSAEAQDCLRWVRRTDVSGPGPQSRHSMVYHRERATTCLVTSGPTLDVWEYNGVQWRLVPVDGPTPPPRQDAGMAYDEKRVELVLVGGLAINGKVFLGDIWTFRITAAGRGFWTSHGDGLGTVVGHQMVYDHRSGEVVGYGGYGWSSGGRLSASAAMTTWNGARQAATFLPPGRIADHAVAYDHSVRNRIISYGGMIDLLPNLGKPAVWQAFGTVQSLGPDGHTILAQAPQRVGHRMVYDSHRERMVVFGGGYLETVTTLDDRRLLLHTSPHMELLMDGRLDPVVQPALSGPTPEPRVYHGMVYDTRRRVVVLYGGFDGLIQDANGSLSSTTWELEAAPLTIVRQPPERVDVCLAAPNEFQLDPPAELTVEMDSNQPYRYQWRRHGLPLEGNPTAQTSRLLLGGPGSNRWDHWGFYDVLVTTDCGSRVFSTKFTEVRSYHPPIFVTDPVPQHVCPGEPATLAAAAVLQYVTTPSLDSEPDEVVVRTDSTVVPRYEWHRISADARGNPEPGPGTPVPGANQASLIFTSMQESDNGYYSCHALSSCGRSVSAPVELTAGVWIKAHPVSLTNQVCDPVSFSVSASGKGTLRYQWRRNRQPLANDGRVADATTARLRIGSLRYLDDAEYDCVITDACHSRTSRVASVSVLPNPPFLLVATNGPAARSRHGLVYDSVRGVSVLFGGIGDGPTVAEAYRNDTWEYDGTNWVQRFPAISPSGRHDFVLAFDRHRGRVVLFGGSQIGRAGEVLPGNETWEYDGTTWTQRQPVHAPPARSSGALFYDPIHRVTTLYGGQTTLANPLAGDIWTWDGSDWTEKIVTGDRPLLGGQYGSPARPRMVWDEAHGYAVLPPVPNNDGRQFELVTWTWNGSAWKGFPHSFAGFGNTPAQTGSGMSLAYDPYRREVLYWSGDYFDQDYIWRWNGHGWRRDDLGLFVGLHLDAAATYDERRQSVVLFGGNYAGDEIPARGYSPRTFERVLADEPIVLRQPVPVVDPSTGKPSLRIVAAGAPPLTYEWQRNGVRLTESASYTGTTNAVLVLAAALAGDTGLYRCTVRGRCGETTSRPVGLIPHPTLQLTTRSAPVGGVPGLTLAWTEPGVILEQAPTPDGPWTPVAGARSPFNAPPAGPAGFFRLRQP